MRHIRIVALLAVAGIVSSLLIPVGAHAATGQVSTWLGHVYAGDGGDANTAFLDTPLGFTADAQCNLYIADTQDYVIRRIDHSTNVITTVLGNGTYGNTIVQTSPKSSQLKAPFNVVQSPSGTFFVSDRDEGTIRFLNADQTLNRNAAKGLVKPSGLASDGTYLYVAETGRNRILRFPLSTIETSTSALVVTAAETYTVLNTSVAPYAIAVDGNVLYATSNDGTKLLKFSLDGSNPESTLRSGLQGAEGVTIFNHDLYFVTHTNGTTNQINRYRPSDGSFTILQNVDETEWYNHNTALTFCGGSMYLLMSGGSSVFKADLDGSHPVKIAGLHRWGDLDGPRVTALLGRPWAMIHSGLYLYILENQKFEKFNLITQTLSFMAGHAADNFVEGGSGSTARISGATAMVMSKDGKTIYFADRNNNRVRQLTIATNTITSISGAGLVNMFNNQTNGYNEGSACTATMTKGVAGCAYFTRPTGIAISNDGKTLYVADSGNNRIRAVTIATGKTALIAGSSVGYKNGVGSAAKFNSPQSLLLSRDGKTLYVAEQGNNVIRSIDLKTKRVTTLAGVGRAGYRDGAFGAAVFSLPSALAWGANANTIYLSEVGSQRIRVLDLKTKRVSTLAGSGQRGTRDGAANVASFNNPRGMVQLTPTTLLVADYNNDLIRAIRTK